MTIDQFQNLWQNLFAPIPIVNMEVPDYYEFMQAERMFQDYLDIFRGENTRNENDNMPYPHPFFDEMGNPLLEITPSIKYILVGEARPAVKPPQLTNGCLPYNGDLNNSFFYNVLHLSNTPWLNAPRLNWGCPPYNPCPSNKIQTLLCLASKGVILIDLFPYAISYTPAIRAALNHAGVTRSFWDDIHNPFNLQNRIRGISGLLDNDWDLSLVAPCKISGHIINPINHFPHFTIIPAGLHPLQFHTLMPDPTRCPLGGDFRKVAVSGAGSPTSNLINLSF